MKKSAIAVLEPRGAETNRRRPGRALDGETLVFTAEDEIQLTCGKSSITLHKSGRVVIKGVEIVSRATRTNKVKGGSVQIN